MADGNLHIRLTSSGSQRAEPPARTRRHSRNKIETCLDGAAADGVLRLSETSIRRWAHANHAGNLFFLLLKQALSEVKFKLKAKRSFRTYHNRDACDAYCQMPTELFRGINARQFWSNWRTIPRNLNGRLRNHRVRMLDLCCGIGDSTQVLAFYAPDESEILGLEYNPAFVAHARTRRFTNHAGRSVNVNFRAQSVLDVFRDSNDAKLADGSVDVVNSCGAVACHFDLPATVILAREIGRVLTREGFAMIDTGPGRGSSRRLVEIFEDEGFKPVHQAKSCFADRYTHVCFRKR